MQIPRAYDKHGKPKRQGWQHERFAEAIGERDRCRKDKTDGSFRKTNFGKDARYKETQAAKGLVPGVFQKVRDYPAAKIFDALS